MFSEPDTEPTKTREHLVNLINLNREYQDVLKMCVKQTEAALLRNTELQVIIGTFCAIYISYLYCINVIISFAKEKNTFVFSI